MGGRALLRREGALGESAPGLLEEPREARAVHDVDAHSGDHAASGSGVQRGGERRLGRLNAMGYDAYQLVMALFANRGGTMEELVGATGRLFIGPDGRIHRKLAWARFERGTPVAIPDDPGISLPDNGIDPQPSFGEAPAWPDQTSNP